LGIPIVIARARLHSSIVLAAALLAGCGGSSEPAPEARTPGGTPGGSAPAPPDAAPEAAPPLPRVSAEGVRGMWVLAEGSRRVLEDTARVEQLVDDAVALGVTDLLVQVYRGGRAWYDAGLADRAPYEALLAANGQDTLALLIEQAHAAGLRVHAWVNVLSLSTNTDAAVIDRLGREAVLVDRFGRSMLDYPGLEIPEPDRRWYRMGTRGVYLDPGAPGVADHLIAVFSELVERYPGLDGLHLDYIRHPGVLPFVPGSRFGVGLDFGYGEATVRRYQEQTGLRGPWRDPAAPDPTELVNTSAWDDWRRQQVTDLVAGIGAAVRAGRPDFVVSAAVIAYVDRAYLSLAQDWRAWLETGALDLVMPMAYTLDDRLLRYQAEHFAGRPHGERILGGLGVWLFASAPERALRQIRIARDAGMPADVLFSYDSIVDSPALLAALAEAAQTGEQADTPSRPPAARAAAAKPPPLP